MQLLTLAARWSRADVFSRFILVKLFGSEESSRKARDKSIDETLLARHSAA